MTPLFLESLNEEASTALLPPPQLHGQSQAALLFDNETDILSGSDCATEAAAANEADPAGQSTPGAKIPGEGIPDLDVGTLVLHGTKNGYQVSGKGYTWIPDSPWTDTIYQDEDSSYPSAGVGPGLHADLIGLLLPGQDYMV